VNAQVQSETVIQACLRDLRTTDPHYDKVRIQNTNGELLRDLYCWVFDNKVFQQWRDNENNCLLWIRGDPGKGKTMLLCGIIDDLTRSFGHTTNILFFFCQAMDVRINSATAVLRGLIYSLVRKQPSLLLHILSHYDHAGKALFEDKNAWNALSSIFTDILKDPSLRNTYLIIDALDECTTGLASLLDFITNLSVTCPQVKWVVSSRNWREIDERLDTTQTALISLELNEASVTEAVKNFIQYKVHQLAKVKKYSDESRDTICHHLLSNSQGTFL
jgi:archaellum biogenesis ATPase FlaH